MSICPVANYADSVAVAATSLTKMIRRLRKMTKQCQNCLQYDDCPFLPAMQSTISQAISEINDEWGMGVIVIEDAAGGAA